jgi:hypothetical protein
MKKLNFLTTLCLSSAVAGVAHGWSFQQAEPADVATTAPMTTAPATTTTAPGGAERLIATVTGVEGVVQVRESEDQPWQRATVGMQVGENAEFRTGPRSAVRFVIPPDHTITLDRLGTVKVLQAVNDNGVIKTQMGMRYGRTRYSIEAAGREHESTIASPSSTLAVRGTDFSSYDQRPFPAQGVSLQGRVQFRDRRKRVNFGSVAGGKTKVDVNNPNAASVALGESVVDPSIKLARTESEDRLVTTLLQSGATVEFDYNKGIRVVRGGQPPRTDAELVPTLPGALNFVLRWTQPGTDLNLGVFTQSQAASEGLQPIGGINTSPSGGEIAFDHVGGPNGGIEVASWPANFPQQPYTFGSVHISGPNSPATIDVFQNGQRLTFMGPDGQPTSTASYIAGPIDPALATGQVVGFVNIAPPDNAQSKADRPAARRRQTLTPAGASARPMGPLPPARVKKR